MNKYNIEDNINFYDELYKTLDDNDEKQENNICMITGLPLIDNFVTLECNHKFNYNALYKEIYNQKFKFKTYVKEYLNKIDIEKLRKSGKDYFFKCPYCRNIQITLLPYYDNINYPKVYGINSDNIIDSKSDVTKKYSSYSNNYSYTYTKWGYTFSKGECSNLDYNQKKCNSCYSAVLPETNNKYCSRHIRQALREYNILQKQKQKEELKKQKEELKKQKEELKKQKEELKKQKEELKKQKEELKKQKVELKKQKNINDPINKILNENNIIVDQNNIIVDQNKCNCTLKTGNKKGQICGAKVFENNLCKRHYNLQNK
jgi:hypothetical protein